MTNKMKIAFLKKKRETIERKIKIAFVKRSRTIVQGIENDFCEWMKDYRQRNLDRHCQWMRDYRRRKREKKLSSSSN